jgi:DNA polymerase III epsilon subunit-like protein
MDAMRNLVTCIAERCPGGRLPDSYLVVDLETSGFHHTPRNGQKPDVIAQVGVAVVQHREMVDNMAVYVKRPPGTMSEGATAATGITDELLGEKGVEPSEIYPKLVNLFQLYRDSRCMFMGHNMVGFDAPFIAADFSRHGYDFKINPNEYVDTGMMFKAAQLRYTPNSSEDLHKFFCRIKDTRSRAKWNLTLSCQMLGVVEKHGLDMAAAHDAGFDCKVTHLLFEEMRALAGM